MHPAWFMLPPFMLPPFTLPPVHVAHAFDVSMSGVLGVMLKNADKVANGYGLRPFDRERGRSDFP